MADPGLNCCPNRVGTVWCVKRVLVTGSSGRLGSVLCERLTQTGFEVTALVRANESGPPPSSVHVVAGDVRVRNDVDPLVKQVDVVINAATDPSARTVDLDGTHQLAYACTENEVHLVQPSLVGAAESTRRYHRTKVETERLIQRVPGLDWTIARSTQFHARLDEQLAQPVWFIPPDTPFQPVDAREFAARLVGLVQAGPSGLVSDFGGPEILTVKELAEIRQEERGQATRLLPIPPVGSLRGISEGAHIVVGGDRGTVSYRDWLSLNA